MCFLHPGKGDMPQVTNFAFDRYFFSFFNSKSYVTSDGKTNCAGEQIWNEVLMVYCPYLRYRLRKTTANAPRDRRRATCYWNIAIATSIAPHTRTHTHIHRYSGRAHFYALSIASYSVIPLNNNNNNNNNNKYYYLLQLGCHPMAVAILHVYKI